MNNFPNPSPPSISLTPSSGFKSRSRAGTLPSSFLSSTSQHSNSYNGSISNSASPLVSGQQHESLGLHIDSISLGMSSNAIDIPNGSNSNPPKTRTMRSGSFFSTNSIWNDDASSSHSTSQPSNVLLESVGNTSNGNFEHASTNLAPISSNSSNPNSILTAQNPIPNNPVPLSTSNALNLNATSNNHRNRSYTTTAAIPNMGSMPLNSNGNYGVLDSFNQNRLSVSPFASASSKTNDMNCLLDNLMFHMNGNGSPSNESKLPPSARHRSQTFSGATPMISEESMQHPQFMGSNVFSSQSQYSPQQLPKQGNLPQLTQNTQPQQPLLFDDFDFSKLIITTNFENPNLGPTKYILFDNLPQFIDSFKLWSILNNSLGNQRSVGGLKSVRVTSTPSSKLALIECSSIDIAMSLKASFNHLELVHGVILYVAFAKIAEPQPPMEIQPIIAPKQSATSSSSSLASKGSTGNLPKANGSQTEESKHAPSDLASIENSLIQSVNTLVLRSNKVDVKKIMSLINKSIAYPNENYQNNFGPLPDPIPLRQFDSPKLRELRKVLENTENAVSHDGKSSSSNTPAPVQNSLDPEDSNESAELSNKVMSQLELEELCLAMLNELPELCYDYLGNTIVQKIFTLVESPVIKLMMVKEITPFLTQLSIHKNGTWAIQKIINLAHHQSQQKYLIAAALKPYAVKLFNDQFGNYVLQGCAKFGSPYNDFIFETMLDNFIEISFGRFGARCIRTILETANESDSITNEQVVLVAGLIVEFTNELVVNSNGSLLITWFLDTFNDSGSTVDDRFALLTSKVLPNLGKLCTHKLANLTILKILNNRSDLHSKQLIMDSIFGTFDGLEYDETKIEHLKAPSKLLEFILTETSDNSAGPLFIYKILSNPLLLTLNDGTANIANDIDSNRNPRYQHFIVSQIRRILVELNINNFQPYKKLMDEVGLSSNRLNRSGSLGGRRNKRNVGRNSKNQAPGGQQMNSYNNGPMGHPQYAMQQQFQIPPPQQQFPVISQSQGLPNMAQGYQQGMLHHTQPQQTPMGVQMPSHGYNQPSQQQLYQHQQDIAVMQQLEQLSLSSAALGYNSNPGTPGVSSSQRKLFL